MKKSLILTNQERFSRRTKIFFRICTVCFCVCLCAFFIVAVEASAQERAYDFPDGSAPVSVYLEGRRILPEESVIIESVTYVPVRAFSDEMGAESVFWNAISRTATVKKDGITVNIGDKATYIEASGRILYSPTGVKNINDRLFVPIRAIARAFSVNVDWNNSTRTVVLTSTGRTITSGDNYYNSTDLYWLSRIINAEASGESLLGMIAVGNVVLNRKASNQYPSTVYGVIFDRNGGTQFSPVSMGTIYRTPSQASIIAAKICLDGYSVDNRILFFMNPKIATSNWISKNRPFAFTIGQHDFYY